MPILQNVDLATVSTEFELRPEGEYLATILSSEFSEDEKSLIVKHRLESAPEGAEKFVGQEYQNWINIKQNDGQTNQIGLQTIKRYLEAVFGKDSSESQTADTDQLNGHQVRLYIIQKDSTKNGETKTFNNVKRIMKA